MTVVLVLVLGLVLVPLACPFFKGFVVAGFVADDDDDDDKADDPFRMELRAWVNGTAADVELASIATNVLGSSVANAAAFLHDECK